MGLPNSEDCSHLGETISARALEIQKAGTREDEAIGLQYLTVLWVIAGHLARLSQALGQDPESPRDDSTVPF